MFQRLLMVCTGNICRSPMAEGLFKFALKDFNIQIQSAGLHALVDKPAVTDAQIVSQQHGIDISAHRARQLSAKFISEAELILVMENWQKEETLNQYPESRGKVFLLGHWDNFEIYDPYQEDFPAFENAFSMIQKGFEGWNKKLCWLSQ